MGEHNATGIDDLRRTRDLQDGSGNGRHLGVVRDHANHRFGKQDEERPKGDREIGGNTCGLHAIAVCQPGLPLPHALSDQRLRAGAEPETREERHEERGNDHLRSRLLNRSNHAGNRRKHQKTQENQEILE